MWNSASSALRKRRSRSCHRSIAPQAGLSSGYRDMPFAGENYIEHAAKRNRPDLSVPGRFAVLSQPAKGGPR